MKDLGGARESAKDIASREGFYWGKEVINSYFARAERDMDQHWQTYIGPILDKYQIDYTHVVDLAAGHGRNSARLAPKSKRITVVDINPKISKRVRNGFGAIGGLISFAMMASESTGFRTTR